MKVNSLILDIEFVDGRRELHTLVKSDDTPYSCVLDATTLRFTTPDGVEHIINKSDIKDGRIIPNGIV